MIKVNTTKIRIYRSILSEESLKKIIAKNFFNLNLDNFKVKILSIGDNDHYLVYNLSKRYILRVYRYNKHWLSKEADYLFEIELLNFLKNSKVKVIYPIAQDDGSYIGKLIAPEGIRYWSLFSYADGNKVVLDDKNSYLYGKEIAKFHVITNKFSFNYKKNIDLDFLLESPLKRLNLFFQKNKVRGIEVLFDSYDKIKKEIKNFATDLLIDEWGVIGGDFHECNFHKLVTDEVILFDFDLCGYGWRAYDIAVVYWSLFCFYLNNKTKFNFKGSWQNFLRGYQEIRMLSEAELKVIHSFAIIRQIWFMGSKITYKDHILSEEYWDINLNELKILCNYANICDYQDEREILR